MAHKLLQDENGILYLAKEVEQVAVEDAQELYAHLKSDLALVEKFIQKELNPQPLPPSPVDQGQAPATDAAPQVDAPVAPADPNAQPALADQSAPAVDPNAPAPVLDANGNPVQPAPDPNAQPEQPVMPPLQ